MSELAITASHATFQTVFLQGNVELDILPSIIYSWHNDADTFCSAPNNTLGLRSS